MRAKSNSEEDWSDAAKQPPQANPKSVGNLFDVDQGQVPHAPLNATVIGTVHSRGSMNACHTDNLFDFMSSPSGFSSRFRRTRL